MTKEHKPKRRGSIGAVPSNLLVATVVLGTALGCGCVLAAWLEAVPLAIVLGLLTLAAVLNTATNYYSIGWHAGRIHHLQEDLDELAQLRKENKKSIEHWRRFSHDAELVAREAGRIRVWKKNLPN